MPSEGAKVTLYSLSLYYTDTTGPGYRTRDFLPRNLIKSLKQAYFKGYSSVTVGGRNRTISTDDPSVALAFFAEQFASLPLSKPYPIHLCAIPDSQCTVAAERSSNVQRMVEAACAGRTDATSWDGLRFNAVMPKSSETNMRDQQRLYDAIRIVRPIPSGKIVLIDDVCTSGAHLLAAARRLREAGASAVEAAVAGRTTHTQHDKVMGWFQEDLEGG